MDEPKAVGSHSELDVLKAQISHLTSDISSLSEIDLSKDDLKFDDVVKILRNEIASTKNFLTFETERKQQLSAENKRLTKYVAEEKNILKYIKDYLDTHGKPNESTIMDERNELFFKFEILHRKVISLIKKFSKCYFPPPIINCHTEDLFLSAACSDTDVGEPKKSLLDILSVLIVELGLLRKVEDSTGFLKVDDTVPQEYIEMLVCADIIERCSENSSLVKLK